MATERLKEAARKEQQQLDKGFDEAVGKKTVTIEIEGREFDVPAQKPAWIDLFIARHGRGEGKNVPVDKYLDFILNLMGDEVVDYIIEKADNDFNNEDLLDTIAKIQSVWMPKGDVKK